MPPPHRHRSDRLRADGWLLLDDIPTTPYRRSTVSPHASCASESGGAYDAEGPDPSFDPGDPGPAGGSPLPALAEALDELERVKRKVLDRYRDVTAWGGTAQTTGYSKSEWVALVGRLPGREEWKLELLATRLPAAPVTAALLADGQITIDQALTILSGTKALSGDSLAEVEATAAQGALDRNRRGDDPDCEADVDQLVQRTRKASEQDRLDRDRLERNSVRVQPDIFGAGRITEDWADPQGFQTRLAAIEHAAGPPSPGLPRGAQLAEGSLATARAWLAGADTHPAAGVTTSHIDHAPDAFGAPRAATDESPDHGDPTASTEPTRRASRSSDDIDLTAADNIWGLPTSPDAIDLGPSSARPRMIVRIDVADLALLDLDDPATLRRLGTGSNAAFGRLLGAGRLSSTPWLGRQLLDTLACNADLIVSIVDGERPLAEFKRTKRLPDRIRRQVLWRDTGCRWPGCRAPVAHVDVHHLDEDPTNHDVDNLLSLCRRHHRRLHSDFWHWAIDGTTGRFDLLRSEHGDPVHTTYPNGTPPGALEPPEVATPS